MNAAPITHHAAPIVGAARGAAPQITAAQGSFVAGMRRVGRAILTALEAAGSRRAAAQLEARAAMYQSINPGFAQELRDAASRLREV